MYEGAPASGTRFILPFDVPHRCAVGGTETPISNSNTKTRPANTSPYMPPTAHKCATVHASTTINNESNVRCCEVFSSRCRGHDLLLFFLASSACCPNLLAEHHISPPVREPSPNRTCSNGCSCLDGQWCDTHLVSANHDRRSRNRCLVRGDNRHARGCGGSLTTWRCSRNNRDNTCSLAWRCSRNNRDNTRRCTGRFSTRRCRRHDCWRAGDCAART